MVNMNWSGELTNVGLLQNLSEFIKLNYTIPYYCRYIFNVLFLQCQWPKTVSITKMFLNSIFFMLSLTDFNKITQNTSNLWYPYVLYFFLL